MRKIHFFSTLKHSFHYIGPAFLIPVLLIALIDLHRDMKRIDEWLLSLAQSVPLLLEGDFHDRAVDADSISFEEELWNRKLFNDYARYNKLAWVYTLIEKEGKLYMTAPTVSAEEAQDRARWYFFEYESAPEEFYQALESKERNFINYRDDWGRFRTIILPLDSPAGNPYAVCIDLAISSYIKLMVRTTGFKSLIILFSFCLVIVYISILTNPDPANSHPSRHLLLRRKDLQKIIDSQTEHLHRLTEKEKINNRQLTNALYAGQMGLYSFNINSGKLVHAFNNLLPETLGYEHGQYQLDLEWMLEHIVDPEFIPSVRILWEKIVTGKNKQSYMDLKMIHKEGMVLWYKIHLTLQPGTSREEDCVLVLTQEIQDVKMRERVLLQQVQTDDLTGLYNRAYWEEYFQAIQSRNRRSDLPLIICYIDINGLKSVNDNLGHNAGDKLLTDFAGILNKTIRGSDIAVRMGGDEFLLICPQTYELEFNELWSRILKSTEKLNTTMDRDYTLSFSHGICVLNDLSDDKKLHSLLAEADRKMYREKREMKKAGLVILRS